MHRKPFVLIVLASCMGWLLSYIEVESHPPSRWQKGWASWYGKAFEGRQTASGERFSPHELTAAHRQLPLGTKVMVKNLETDALVEVRINDRGPYADPPRRIIDLSRAAAESIGLVEQGIGRVQVMVTEEAPSRQEASTEIFYEVQVGTFEDRREASTMVEALQDRYPATYMIGRDRPLGRYYRVRIGPFDEQAQPRRIARELKGEGYGLFIDEVLEQTLLSQELS